MSNILFIASNFYEYRDEIARELRKKYSKVFIKNEYPLGGILIYSLIEKFASFLLPYIWHFYMLNIIKVVEKEDVTTVFVIKGAKLPERLFQKLRKFKNIKIVQYQWDSFANNPNAMMICKYTDLNFTFDKKDADSKKFNYLPLFYNWRDLHTDVKQETDLLLFGAWSADRFKTYTELKKFCDNNHLSLKAKFYMPFQSYVKCKLKGLRIPDHIISFKTISRSDYYNLLSSTKIVFDNPSKNQTGSSMRTIETISLKKKLITTNTNVKNELFFCPENIQFWPLDSQELAGFIQSEFNETSLNYIYNISEWLKKMNL